VWKTPVEVAPSAALARGNEIHEHAERFVNGEVDDLHESLYRLEKGLRDLRKRGAIAESGWGLTEEWEPIEWDHRSVWLRLKVDVLHPLGKSGAKIIDYKTGKCYPDHPEQLGLYALATFRMFPELEIIHAEDWYVDTGIVSKTETFTKREEPMLRKMWSGRAKPLFEDTVYAPTANKFCKWCPFSKLNGGPCEF
jgi:hypothetical protein